MLKEPQNKYLEINLSFLFLRTCKMDIGGVDMVHQIMGRKYFFFIHLK